MTTNKVCGKGKCKFTDEFCASGDCPYDPDVLKNNDNFNIKSENVKLDDIRPRFRKCKEIDCDKMYNCQEKMEIHSTNNGWTMDYFCKRKNTFVYWE